MNTNPKHPKRSRLALAGFLATLLFTANTTSAQVDFKTLQKAVAKDSIKNSLPKYNGGREQLESDLYKHVRPGPAYAEKLCAKFDISAEGKISKVHFFRPRGGHGIDSIAYEKAMLQLTAWTPARLNKKIVAVSGFTIMIEDPNLLVVPIVSELRPASIEDPEIFTIVEHQPEPPGGFTSLRARANFTIARPAAYANEPETKLCKVHLKFVIDTLGNCIAPEILRSCKNCPELSKMALEFLAAEKKWTPGMQNNRKVKVYFNLPVIFYFKD